MSFSVWNHENLRLTMPNNLPNWNSLVCLYQKSKDSLIFCSPATITLACSMLRDSGGKSFSKKKCEKRAGARERQGGIFPIFPAVTAPFPKSCTSYFRFARFNIFPLYYLRAWHRLRSRSYTFIKKCKHIRNLICMFIICLIHARRVPF